MKCLRSLRTVGNYQNKEDIVTYGGKKMMLNLTYLKIIKKQKIKTSIQTASNILKPLFYSTIACQGKAHWRFPSFHTWPRTLRSRRDDRAACASGSCPSRQTVDRRTCIDISSLPCV